MESTRVTRRTFARGLGLAGVLELSPRLFAGASSPSTMTVEQTRATMEGYLETMLSGGAYETYFAGDIVVTFVGSEEKITGPDAAKRAIDALLHEQFDAKLKIQRLTVGPGRAALEVDLTGRQIGIFAGIPANGRYVEVLFGVFSELEDGEITAQRIYGLTDGLYRQLVTIPKM